MFYYVRYMCYLMFFNIIKWKTSSTFTFFSIKLNIFTVENTLTKISKIEALSENIMMIFGNTKDVRQFCESYSNVKEINYGGIIKKEGSKQFSNAIFLTENEIEDAKVLKSMGIKQFMQQVPTSKKEDLNTMI